MSNRHDKNECDILLIGSEDEEENEHLGLRYISSFLIKHQVRVQIGSSSFSEKEKILTKIRKINPRIVGFSLRFQRLLFELADLLAYLRQNGIKAHFTVGGHFPTIEFEGTLATIPELDSIIRCEGEITLLELFHNLDQPDLWGQVKGLVYRSNNHIIVTPSRPLIEDLDCLPFPVRLKVASSKRGLGICSIVASRGCLYNCSYCSITQFYSGCKGSKRRSRSPSNVVKEMVELFYEKGVRVFIFLDDDFAMKGHLQREWVEEFIKELKKSNIADHIIWVVQCRIDEVYTDLVKKMMEVGLKCICMGIETSTALGLKTFNKGYVAETIHEKLVLFQDLDLSFEFGFMILNPDSTISSVREDVEFLREISMNSDAVIVFSKMIPYAGTSIAYRLEKKGILGGTIDSPNYRYKDFKLELLEAFLAQAFYFRNYNKHGLVVRLRNAKLDAWILEKYYSIEYDTRAYNRVVQDLVHKCNAVCIENFSLALNFIEQMSEEDIINNWNFLDHLARKEKNVESSIELYLDFLTEYNA
ncbi:cobalamin-dependent protein [bacterium]|nr:cobalamin-dependent protein [bacterium]